MTDRGVARAAGRIRPYRPEDEAEVAALWHRTGLAAYPYLPTWQALTADEALRVFREVIASRCEMHVAEQGGRIVAYLAIDGGVLERLYVDPRDQRAGWGTRLLAFAKQQRPDGLSLFTHQENHVARAFYEKHGFTVVRFGTSPPPESAPDVEYAWTPAGAGFALPRPQE
jgi:ribosomal protein S18 acetylase RimI-like enzyme